jgi:myosin heavy subunit
MREKEVLLDFAEDAEEHKRNIEAELRQATEQQSIDHKEQYETKIAQLQNELNNAFESNHIKEERLKLKLESDINKLQDLGERDQLIKENTELNYEVQSLRREIEELWHKFNKEGDGAISNLVLELPRASTDQGEVILKASKTYKDKTLEEVGGLYKKEREELARLNEELKKQNEDLVVKINSLEKKVQEYNCKNVEDWDNIMNENKRLSMQLESERSSQDQLLKSLHKELDIVEKENEVKEQELNEVHELLRRTNAEVNKIKGELEVAKESVNNKNETVEKLKTELNLKIIEVTEYESKMKDANMEQRRLVEQIEHADNQNKQLAVELSTKDIKSESLHNQLLNLKIEIKKLENEYKQMEDKLLLEEKSVADLRAKQGIANRQIRSLEQDNQELHSQLNKELIRIEAANTELDTLRPELTNLQQTASLYKGLREQFEEFSSEMRETFYRVGGIVNYINEKHKHELEPLIEMNADIFGTDLTNIAFPVLNSSVENYPKQIVEWLSTYKYFIDIVVREFEIIVENTRSLRTELSKLKNINEELEGLIRIKLNDISLCKEKERNLVDESKSLQDKILYLQREQEKLLIE